MIFDFFSKNTIANNKSYMEARQGGKENPLLPQWGKAASQVSG